MKLLFFLVLPLFVFSNNSFSSTADTIPANDSFIEYTGRIDFSNPLAPRFSYPGISIRTYFKGSGIYAILDDEYGQNYFNIILDDSLISVIKADSGKHSYLLAKNLKNTIHQLEIFKRTENMFGKITFYGFIVNQGSLVELKNKRTRLIEFIGNSITCGYGNEGKLGEKFGASTENQFMTYAAITARNFNARQLAVCKSGIGIYRNYNGPAIGNYDCMPNFYQRIFLYDSLPVYDFKQKPDLICIDLGTNDFSTNGGDSAKYVNGYLRFIDTIQRKYQRPDILILLGPMLKDNDLIRVRKYLKFISAAANEKNAGNVYLFEMSQQTGNLGFGVDYHPTVAQHKKNAAELTDFISKLMGWPVEKQIQMFP